ncbi:MAG: beta-1,6-N-acetylglucosaminyltransferase, partial [Actinomycetota bacterium]|nr:beta-1,6-N-acetylglucosaminyltransferase [Actinomycetota bacterium]
SGQDYPIKSREQIDRYLAGLDGASLIHNDPFPVEFWHDGGWGRIQQFHMHDRPRWVRGVVRAANASPLRRRYPRGLHPHGGAQFWAMSHTAVKYVLDFVDRNPKFVRYYRRTLIPDEGFFQTILGNAGDAVRRENDCINHLEWDRPGMVLTGDDFATLAQTHYLFARKFDSRVDSAVLDRIDRELL